RKNRGRGRLGGGRGGGRRAKGRHEECDDGKSRATLPADVGRSHAPLPPGPASADRLTSELRSAEAPAERAVTPAGRGGERHGRPRIDGRAQGAAVTAVRRRGAGEARPTSGDPRRSDRRSEGDSPGDRA